MVSTPAVASGQHGPSHHHDAIAWGPCVDDETLQAAGADVLRQVRLDVEAHVGPSWGG